MVAFVQSGIRYWESGFAPDGDCTDDSDGVPGSNTGDEHLYYCQDANYNVTALVEDYDGEVVERYMYSPYGEVTVLHGVRDSSGTDTSADEWSARTSNTFENALSYCGYYHDWETGLYHVRHRYYHPPLGRWTSRDPIGYVDGVNLHQYAAGQPATSVDPSGRKYGCVGVNLGGTLMVPNITGPMFAVGIGGGYSAYLCVGWDAKGTFCKTCESVSITIIPAGVGASVSAGAGPVIVVGGGRPKEGLSIQLGAGAGFPITGKGANVEVTIDVDVENGDVTITVPRLTAGLTAYVAFRVTGSCTGCSDTFKVWPWTGRRIRKRKIVQCLKGIRAALKGAVNSLNNKTVPANTALSIPYRGGKKPFTVDKIPPDRGS